MPRLARKNIETSYCHTIVQGINKENIFEGNALKDSYISILKKNLIDKHIEILSYCIMDNHAHILIYFNQINDLTKFMQKTNTSYARLYNKMNNRVGFVFRDRYFTQMILSDTQLFNCISYIHYNPINAHMVSNLADYKYSSYQEYIGKSQRLITNESKKLALGSTVDYDELFKEIHYKQDIEDIADVIEEVKTSEQIIQEFTGRIQLPIEEIINRPNDFCELLLQLRHYGNLTLRDMSEIFNINKDKLNKIINLKFRN